jgi:protein associated with RNAse G/E
MLFLYGDSFDALESCQKGNAMINQAIIKSFKHNGSIHRVWLENWRVPTEALTAEHANEQMHVFVSNQTPIIEADGKEWVSRVPSVSFFIPGQWYNIVALIETTGIRYYCNIASPSYWNGDMLTYIDYDLDVIVLPGGSYQVVDEDEYVAHQHIYHYSAIVKEKVEAGLSALLARVVARQQPFDDEAVNGYFDRWKMVMLRGEQ